MKGAPTSGRSGLIKGHLRFFAGPGFDHVLDPLRGEKQSAGPEVPANGEIKWASIAKSTGMIRDPANKRAPSAHGIFSPLRYAVFRRSWTASLLSNLGILVLGVAATWTMTQISSSADMVALV